MGFSDGGILFRPRFQIGGLSSTELELRVSATGRDIEPAATKMCLVSPGKIKSDPTRSTVIKHDSVGFGKGQALMQPPMLQPGRISL